ncbi:207_t:CDS:10 [Ambispora leptoticha]|uniref:E3 ubiquitin-protein ligase listerin n=1 Tax=Ambispora leptoticha TaxID=144679 RepID=A0A9N9AXH6_9GLOM|nr:207_t:CDS:10 [Ambispora leptoticha]
MVKAKNQSSSKSSSKQAKSGRGAEKAAKVATSGKKTSANSSEESTKNKNRGTEANASSELGESLVNFTGVIDADLSFIMKKLAKRDTTTKLKALEELEGYLHAKEAEGNNVTGLEDAVEVWANFYVRLAIDSDHRVRLATNTCHLLIVSKLKKRLAPNLKEIIGVWVTSFFDQNKDVARVAMESFQAAFSVEKRNEVLLFGQAEILNYVSEVIFQKTPETLNGSKYISQEEMEQKYARVVSSSYYAIAYLIEQLGEIELSKAIELYDNLFDNPKFWENLSNQNPLIRKSCYNLIKTLSTKWPKKIEERLESLSYVYLSNIFNDKDARIHGDLWDSLLMFTRSFPQSWVIASKEKPMLPELYHFLEFGAFGSVNVSYPSLLPLISQLPPELLSTDREFYSKFFTNFWKGLTSGTIDRSNSASFFKAKSENERDIQTYLIDKEFFRLVELYLVGFQGAENKFQARNMCNALSTHIISLLTKSKDASDLLLERTRNLVIQTINNDALPEISSNRNAEADYKEFSQRLIDLLGSLSASTKIETREDRETINRLITNIFLTALAKCEQSWSQSEGLYFLLATLTRDFIDIIFSDIATLKALENFLDGKFHENIILVPLPSANYLIDIFWTFLTHKKDSHEIQHYWNALISTVLKTEDMDSKLKILSCSISNRSFGNDPRQLFNEELDVFLLSLTNTLNEQLEEDIREQIENLLYVALVSTGYILKPESRMNILNKLADIISKFIQHYFASENIFNIRKESILSSLRIFDKLSANSEFLGFLLNSNLTSVIGNIYELIFLKTNGGLGEDTINTLIEASKRIWQEIVQNREVIGRKDSLAGIIVQKIKSTLFDIHYSVSPTDFAQRVIKIIQDLYENDRAKIQEILAQFLLDDKQWREFSEPFLSLMLESSLFSEPQSITTTPEASQAGLSHSFTYDSYGLSIYARQGLFLVELINKYGIEIFHKKNCEDDEEDELTIKINILLLELLSFYILCANVISAHNTGRHIWDATSGEERKFQIFKTLQVDILSALKRYLSTSLSETPFNFKECLSRLGHTTDFLEEDDEIIDLQSLLIETIKRAHGDHSRHWSRVLELLISNVFSIANLSTPMAEKFLEFVKTSSLNLEINLALISSLRPYLELSAKYKAFQNNLAGKLCNLDAKDIFIKDNSLKNNGWTYMSLLVTTASKDDQFFLQQARARNLLQRIQTWYAELKDVPEPASYTELVHVHTQVARLLNLLVPITQDLYASHWNFILQRIQTWLQLESSLALRYEAIQLYNRLENLSASSVPSDELENELSLKLEEYQPQIYELLANFFFEVSTHKNEILSDSYSTYLDALSITCQSLSLSLLTPKASQLYEILLVPHVGIQTCTYSLLRKMTKEKVVILSEELEIISSSDNTFSAKFDEGLSTLIAEAHQKDYLKAVINGDHNILSLHHTFGYFLAWKLILDHFDFTTQKLKSHYLDHLRNKMLDDFLPYAFQTMGLISTVTKPFDLNKWDFTEFFVEAFEIELGPEIGFPVLSAHLYYRALRHFPSAIRGWWAECKKRHLYVAVDNYTEKYFSPVIIQQQIDQIQREDVKAQLQEDDKMLIRIARATNEVIAEFRIDEYAMELSLRMPNSFPLRQIEAHTVEHLGKTEVKDLKKAQLPIQAVINTQDGSLEVALNLYKKNMSLHFEGYEDCPICYSVISLDDRSLPTKPCPTCKYRFHKLCLYKWFRSSNDVTCPLCRQFFNM